MSSIKDFLIVGFAFFAVTGLALGYLASYLLLRVVAYLSPWLPVWMWYADIGLFLHAVAVTAISTVGVIAVLANKAPTIKFLSYLLVSMLLIEIVVTVQLTTRATSLDTALSSDLETAMKTSQNYYSFNISDTQMWDEIQLEANCCGAESYEDWLSTKFGDGSSVPDSCCLLVVSGCGVNITSETEPEDEIITEGCLPTLMSSIRFDFNYYGYYLWLPVLGMQVVLVVAIIYLSGKMTPGSGSYSYIWSTSSSFMHNHDDGSKYEQLKDDPRM